MVITEQITFIFTSPEDDDRLQAFVKSQNMNDFKRERLGPNVTSYTKKRVRRTTSTSRKEEVDA